MGAMIKPEDIEMSAPCVCCGQVGVTVNRWGLDCAINEARADARGTSYDAQQSADDEEWGKSARAWFRELLDLRASLHTKG